MAAWPRLEVLEVKRQSQIVYLEVEQMGLAENWLTKMRKEGNIGWFPCLGL